MSTVAQTIPGSAAPFGWIGRFLKEELSPYPGRTGLVARMVLATTVVMIVSMTFQLSFAYQGAVVAFFISRENARSTWQAKGLDTEAMRVQITAATDDSAYLRSTSSRT